MPRWLTLFALLTAACSDEDVKIGVVDAVTPGVVVPSSAAVGTEVVVTMDTDGGGCTSVYSTESAATSDGFEITTYDATKTNDDS